ncbi:hypothetical protein L210DRAFT_3502651 [Boletus edulis BED1]|uniref:Uncharacterized protein n=1 Tax=Boletus edulis BED1 TaxID=1328754 RepID=A0AAD4GH58_BOLED|nr:hypothetical protein L210DRAFT_3502651 [Boletus edulis BED1]
MGRSRLKKKHTRKRCWCKPTCGKQLSRTGRHKHYTRAAKLGLFNQIAPSESESHSIASNLWTSDEASETENHHTVSDDGDRRNGTVCKCSNEAFVVKYDGNTTDSSYYSAVNSKTGSSGSDGSDSGSDRMDSGLRDEEARSESSFSLFGDEDIVDEDFINIERQGELFATRKSL